MIDDNDLRASYGRTAIEAGTPDFEQNEPHTNAVDAIANILHALAYERPEYDAREVLNSALSHFLDEIAGEA